MNVIPEVLAHYSPLFCQVKNTCYNSFHLFKLIVTQPLPLIHPMKLPNWHQTFNLQKWLSILVPPLTWIKELTGSSTSITKMWIKSLLCYALCTTIVPTPPPKQPQICLPQRSISPKGVAQHLVLFCSTRFKRLQLQQPKLPLLLQENIVLEEEDPLEIVAEAHCLLILFRWDILEVTADHQGMSSLKCLSSWTFV